MQCSDKPLKKPTSPSVTAARMGAGIVECDVTFIKDKQLVCRTRAGRPPYYNQYPGDAACAEMHQGIYAGDLQSQRLAENTGVGGIPHGKMDAFGPTATTVAEFMEGTPNFRTDLYASRGTLITHGESIQLFKQLGVKMTPELKLARCPNPKCL